MTPAADSPFPVMEQMTVKMVRQYLERKKSIIVPMGVIEQHGYHLPLGTDAIIAEHLGRMIGERTGILVAPVIYQSFSGGGLPGTINISPAVMSLVVSDMLLSLAAQGFRNLYLLLCHGGSENARAIAEGDWHAGWLETSMIMALAPELVRMQDLELDPEPLLRLQIEHPDNYQRAEKVVDDECVVPRMTQRPDIHVGVMGDPGRASPELGRRIIEGVVEAVSAKVRQLESQADGVYREVAFTPPPILLR